MTLIVDANVAIKWFIRQTDRAKAQEVQQYAGDLFAPTLIVSEVASGLWVYVKAGPISIDHARAAVSSMKDCFAVLCADSELIDAAMVMAADLNHSPYDCIYLALAERHNAKFVTADQAFFNTLFKKRRTKNIVMLHQWRP